jgi:hypothetical protein
MRNFLGRAETPTDRHQTKRRHFHSCSHGRNFPKAACIRSAA